MATSSNSRGLVILLLMSSFFITGLLFDYMPLIVDNQIKRTVELATNEEIKALWSKPPVDFHSYYWLYDILNAEQFLKGEKVRVRKVGPYHFSSRIEKRIIELSQNKYRLIYNSTRYLYLNESEQLEGQLDEPLHVLNPIYVSLMETSRETTGRLEAQQRAMLLGSANRLAERTDETLIMSSTPRIALLGRKVKMLEKARKLIETFGLDTKMPTNVPGDVFGFVSLSNGTWNGPFEIYTGYQASMPSLGDIISYKGKRRLSQYQGKCNRIQTSAGELRPMPLGNNQILEMFLPNFCRVVHLLPTGVRNLREGRAIAYILSPEDFLSADSNPDNRCYCVNGTSDNYCSLNGVVELAPCSYYSPIVAAIGGIDPDPRIKASISDWDPDLINSDIELVPNADNGSQLLLLKRIGVPFHADLTFTLFMKVTRDSSFRFADSLPEVSYIPVVMIREIGGIPPKLSGIIVSLESFLTLSHHIKVIMYLSALVLLCWLTSYYYNKSVRDRVEPSTAALNESSSGDSGQGGGRTGNGNGNGSGRDSGASDRANSADSNRSQPPSRVSHSSLDAGAGSSASGYSQRTNIRPRRAVSPAAAAAEGSYGTEGYGEPAGETSSEPSRQQQARLARQTAKSGHQQQLRKEQQKRQLSLTRRSSRIFSKVDDLLALEGASRQAASSNNGAQQQQQRRATATDGGAGRGHDKGRPSGDQLADSQEDADEKDTAADAGKFNEPEVGGAGQPQWRKNWFLKVCSNFVRMLNVLRTTISDASHLDISENDYQDKQLEMLAGKIDNWYGGSEAINGDSGQNNSGGGSTAAASTGETGDSSPALGAANGSSQTAATSASAAATANTKQSRETDRRTLVESSKATSTATGVGDDGELLASGGGNGGTSAARVARETDETDRQLGRNGDSNPGASSQTAQAQQQQVARAASTTAAESKQPSEGSGRVSEPARVLSSSEGAATTAEVAAEAATTTTTATMTEQQRQQPASATSSKRNESGQSNQTIINKSDTSGDESVFSPADDKAKALEQLELALDKKGSGNGASNGDDSGGNGSGDNEGDSNGSDGAGIADGEPEARRTIDDAKKPTMINSSTSIDFTFTQMASEASTTDTSSGGLTNGFGNAATTTNDDAGQAAASANQANDKGPTMLVNDKRSSLKDAQADQWVSNQSAKLNGQIDDQSNELAANGVGDNDAHKLQSATTVAKRKDERRDSGYIRFK